MKQIKETLLYYSYTLFSNKEVIRAYTKSWFIAIGAFTISILVLLTPVVTSKLFVNKLDIIGNLENVDIAFNALYEFEDKGIECKISDAMLVCENDVSYELTSDKYQIYINKNINYNDPLLTSNVIVFNKDYFFMRSLKNGNMLPQILKGDYSRLGVFDFKHIYSNASTLSENLKEQNYIINTANFLNSVELSNFNTYLALWSSQYIISSLGLAIVCAILLNFGNNRGQRADEYRFKGSLKISLVLLLGVSFICSVLGIVYIEVIPVLLSFVYMIRILYIYLHQFTRKGQMYNIVKYKS